MCAINKIPQNILEKNNFKQNKINSEYTMNNKYNFLLKLLPCHRTWIEFKYIEFEHFSKFSKFHRTLLHTLNESIY